jgi:hypothetical protein
VHISCSIHADTAIILLADGTDFHAWSHESCENASCKERHQGVSRLGLSAARFYPSAGNKAAIPQLSGFNSGSYKTLACQHLTRNLEPSHDASFLSLTFSNFVVASRIGPEYLLRPAADAFEITPAQVS